MALKRFRTRLPLIAFILLAILCLLLLGFACACMTDHPMQAIDRALSTVAALPARADVWPVIVLSLIAGALVLGFVRPASRLSPAMLQRFLL